jgi:glycosyltransferase involved in cell wall biosynthesis
LVPKPVTKLKILHLISSLDIGGAEMQLAELLERTDRTRFETIVVCLINVGSVAETIRAQGIPIHSLGMRRSIPSLSAIQKLRALIMMERPQILQTWLYHADLLGLVVAKLTGVQSLVWNVRCSHVEMQHYPKLSKLVLAVLSRLSVVPDAVIVNSEAGRAAHARIGYRPRRFEVIPNGIEVDRFRPDSSAGEWLRDELQLSNEAVIIGLVARYDPMKDHEMFLAAARQVCAKHKQAHFILCGNGVDSTNTELARLIEVYGLTQHIRLLGGRSDIERISAAFDIACSTSAFGEGFSNAVGEAMACGVPCVVTDVGDSALIVGSTGRVVPPRNVNAFANALCELIEYGSQVRQILGAKARARIIERYDSRAMAVRYEQFYLSLCPRPSDDTIVGEARPSYR